MPVAFSHTTVPVQLGHIFYFIVLPLLLVVATGYAIQRLLGLDMNTLKKLNFYFVMPAIIYFSVVTSRISGPQLGLVVGFALSLIATNALLTYLVAAVRGIPRDCRNTMLLTTILHNSGNFGLPLQGFAFRSDNLGEPFAGESMPDPSGAAQSLQAFVMITQNLFTFTIGIFIAAGGKHDTHWRRNLMHIAKFPPIYALAAGAATLAARGALGERAPAMAEAITPLWDALLQAKNAFIGLALVTLGAKLALVPRGGRSYPVAASVLLRLAAGPALGVAIIYALHAAFGVQGFLAQMLLIASAAPTAVNCMLLTLEFDNHPDYAAKAVFWSTVLSPITVTAVILVAQSGVGPFAP